MEVLPANAETGGGLAAPAMVAPARPLSQQELGELIDAFNGVTERLTRTHEALQAEVVKLRRDLSEANQQVERSKHLALLGEMAAGIAHEVRNPLGSILLYARMLREDLADRPSERAVVEKIAGSVQKLEHVVGDVLAFARESRCRMMATDAEELITASLNSARSDGAEWKGLEVRLDVAPGLVMNCDPEQSQRAIVNVLRNAAEIMHESGAGGARRIEIAASLTSQRGAEGKSREMVCVSVRDHGPGLPAESAEKLFTPFFTTKRTGTGLGLAIVHRIMDAHGGRVNLRNHERGGAVAELWWPRG